MAGASQRRSANRVPPVDPNLLCQAVAIVYGWASIGLEEEDSDAVTEQDLFDVLASITRRLEVETHTAVALFKRSLALASYCAEAELAPGLFHDGFPGRELCAAASRVAVLNGSGTSPGPVTPYFDADDLSAAIRAALN